MPARIEEQRLEVLALVLCTTRAEAMGNPPPREACNTCRRQAIFILERRLVLKLEVTTRSGHTGTKHVRETEVEELPAL